jgi:hypothetical protein
MCDLGLPECHGDKYVFEYLGSLSAVSSIPILHDAHSFDVRVSVHHSTIHKEKSNKMQQCIKILLFHSYEVQHVSGDTPPIIRSLKLHWQPLVYHT